MCMCVCLCLVVSVFVLVSLYLYLCMVIRLQVCVFWCLFACFDFLFALFFAQNNGNKLCFCFSFFAIFVRLFYNSTVIQNDKKTENKNKSLLHAFVRKEKQRIETNSNKKMFCDDFWFPVHLYVNFVE